MEKLSWLDRLNSVVYPTAAACFCVPRVWIRRGLFIIFSTTAVDSYEDQNGSITGEACARFSHLQFRLRLCSSSTAIWHDGTHITRAHLAGYPIIGS